MMCLFLAVMDVRVMGIVIIISLLFSCVGPDVHFAANNGYRSSSSVFAGRLEVYINGQLGTICSEGFDIIEANIICRERYYSSAASYGTASDLGYV